MKSVLISGAGRGIGKALCAEGLKRGYKVHALVRKAQDAPAGTTPHVSDIRDRAKIKAILEKLAPELTLYIANAGVDARYNPRDPGAAEKAAEIFEINGTGTVYSMFELVYQWVNRGCRDRHIAVVSSLAAGRGMPTSGLYIATKTAQRNLCQALEHDLRPFGIQVTAIRPGFIRTDMTSNLKMMPFVMEAERAARIIFDGLERGKAEISFPIPTLVASWFRDLVPYFIFRFAMGRMAAQVEKLRKS